MSKRPTQGFGSKWCAAVVLLVVATSTTISLADISWNITFNDVINGTGVGFDDPTHGATRQATFQAALNYINSALDHSGTVDFVVNNSQTDGGGALASAGTLYFTSPNGFSNGLLYQHATTGTDPSVGNPDGSATFDFGYNWNNGLGGPSGSQFDLFSVTLHEISHAMGFASLVNIAGNSGISGGNPGVFSIYDSFLQRGDGTPLFGPGGNFLGNSGDLTSQDVFFAGANAMAANGGMPVQVYAPGVFDSGSSISHIMGDPDFVMNFSIGAGVSHRAYTDIELAILRDLGWSLAPVPEPSSCLVCGLGILVLSMRRRRLASAY